MPLFTQLPLNFTNVSAAAPTAQVGYISLVDSSANGVSFTSPANPQTFDRFGVYIVTSGAPSFGVSVESLNLWLAGDYVEFEYDGFAWRIVADTRKPYGEIKATTPNGYGSSATKIRLFSAIEFNRGNAITYAASASAGSSWTIAQAGIYAVNYSDTGTGVSVAGLSLNASSLTTNIGSLASSQILAIPSVGAGQIAMASIVARLAVGDIIRAHTGADAPNTTSAALGHLRVTKIAN